jgi:hypothetical protein
VVRRSSFGIGVVGNADDTSINENIKIESCCGLYTYYTYHIDDFLLYHTTTPAATAAFGFVCWYKQSTARVIVLRIIDVVRWYGNTLDDESMEYQS